LLARIEAVIAASPFNGEGYRRVRARLRADGVRTSMRKVQRIMRENSLLAPQRPVDREELPHDGTVMTDRMDQMWGTIMTRAVATG
jgi:transposase InsO family protein